MSENTFREMKETTEVCISLSVSFLVSRQVMETKDMLYIVTEFAKNGEMFGKFSLQ